MQTNVHTKHCPRPTWPEKLSLEGRLTEPRSSSIPILHNDPMQRIERKLREEEEAAAQADLRDYIMFRRIVDRISRQDIQNSRLRRENDMCLAHVIGIRNSTDDEPLQKYYVSDYVAWNRSKPADDDPAREDGIFELEL